MGMREEFESRYEPPVGCQLNTRNNEWYQAWDELSGDPDRDQEIAEYNEKWEIWQASRAAIGNDRQEAINELSSIPHIGYLKASQLYDAGVRWVHTK